MADIQPLIQELVAVNNNKLAIQTQISTMVAEFQNQLAQYEAQDTELRKAILDAMEETGQTQPYEDENIKITYVSASQRKGVDLTRLQIEQPEIYKKYLKITNVKSQVRIKVK